MKCNFDNFAGIIPALMTPYDQNDTYDPACSQEMVDWMIAKGVGGFYLTGSNGTGPYMDVEERIRVVDKITEQVNGRVPVVAHIGHVSTKNSIRMAKAAQASGCDGISAVPSYYITLNNAEMQKYYEDITSSVDLPMMVYAQTDRYTPSVEMFSRLSEIENVCAVKYTGPNLYMMGRIKEHLGERLKVYSGYDEMMLAAQIMGADGAIGGTYNVIPEPYMKARELLWEGQTKDAQKYIMIANAIVEVFFKYNIGSAMRVGLKLMGVNAGRNPAPSENMDKSMEIAFVEDLKILKERSIREGITGIELLDIL